MNQKNNRKRNNHQRKKNSTYTELRNRNIAKLFRLLGFGIRLVGNPDKPNFIIDNDFKLPIMVVGNNITINKNFEDKNGLQIKLGEEKINSDNVKDISHAVISAIDCIEKKAIFKIKLGESLYLHNFKYVSKNNNEHIPKYPLFAIYDPKIIYTFQYAHEILKKLTEDGYNQLSVVCPTKA